MGTERWAWVSGHEGRYEVSTMGRVRSYAKAGRFTGSNTTPRLLKTSGQRSGYPFVQLWTDNKAKGETVHRLVAKTFLPAPLEGQEVRHLDGDRKNPRLENLAWGTRSENMQDAVVHGTTYLAGLKRAKLTQLEADGIRAIAAIRGGRRRPPWFKDIGSVFGVNRATVADIVNGKTWTNVAH